MSAGRRTALIILVSVFGIALAAAITWGTSQLVRQHIGLASEPLTVGRRLLAPVPSTPREVGSSSIQRPSGRRSQTSPTPPTSTSLGSPPSSSAPSAPVESAAPPASRAGGDESSSGRDD
jgi:hypothetical protein